MPRSTWDTACSARGRLPIKGILREVRTRMRVTSKKQVNGTNVTIIDTQGASIADIVDFLANDGWQFPKLTVTYTAKGQTKKVDVTPDKVDAIQDKYHFDKWSFAAKKGDMALVCQMSDANRRAIVSKAPNGAAKVFMSIPPATHATGAQAGTPAAAGAQASQAAQSAQAEAFAAAGASARGLTPQQQALLRRKRELQQQQAAQAPQGTPAKDANEANKLREERARAQKEASAAIFAPQEDSEMIPELTNEQRSEKRKAARAADNAKREQVAANKHTGLLIWAIIECLLLIPIAFAGFAILDIVLARRRATEDPAEAETRFKSARNTLIFGIVFATIVSAALFCLWILPNL